jgi:cyclopropane fatty-acyl-phospholipid synthase-like methyltransferase
MNALPSDFKAYDVDLYITEIYDRFETQRDDIAILREQIGQRKRLNILELFSGNGRILIPLAEDGHRITGLDKSPPMLESARRKIKQLPARIQKNVTLEQANVLTEEWPTGFNLVILGGNCLYELATSEEQETCIRKAQKSLKPGGYIYLDNDHMEGDLDPHWRGPKKGKAFPTGVCADGTKVEGSTEVIWHDIKNRLVRYLRTVIITAPDGKIRKTEWHEQCHAPSTGEMKGWLEKYGFKIEKLWGDRKKSPYTDQSERAIFWARLNRKN